MLDIHAPHESVHTWRDFFIHIATIVVGLLIAIGLEQMVEHVHQHYELRDTREALLQEREENRNFMAVNTAEFRLQTAQLQNNLRVLTYLQKHPGTSEDKLPGVLLWSQTEDFSIDSVWKNTEQTQVLSLMPRAEAEDDAQLYKFLTDGDETAISLYDAVQHAGNYALVDPDPSHLTPAQLDGVIEDTKLAMEVDLRWGVWIAVLHTYYPEFRPAPTRAELSTASNRIRSAADTQKLASARAITDAAMAATRASVAALNASDPTQQ